MAPTTGKPGLGLAVAGPELSQPCRFRGDSVTRARGHFHLPAHLCASKTGSAGRRCRCPQPRALAGSRRRPLTAFLPCPLQRRSREQRRAGALAAHRRRARAEGETPASPWSQRDPPLPQQVTRSLLRAFLGRPAPSPPHSAPTARGTPWGGRPTLPALGHLGTVRHRQPVPLLPPRQRAENLAGLPAAVTSPAGRAPPFLPPKTPSSPETWSKAPGRPRCLPRPRRRRRRERSSREPYGSPRLRSRGTAALSPQ